MRSDFTGFPLSNINDTKFKPFSLGDKVKDLEEELSRKDEAIKVLCSELCFFENSFKELEETLWNVIRNYSGKAKKKDVDIAQALKEVFSDMELQSA
jgi:predicted nuclease with TOPRIM domain